MSNEIRISINGDIQFVDPNKLQGTDKTRRPKRRRQRQPKNPAPKEWLASDLSKMMVADYKPFNFVDGEGIRCSIYVSGCKFACPGCYNVVAQNFNYGFPYTDELENQIMQDLSQPYVQGLTFLGGEPFVNTQICLRLAHRVRQEFGHSKDLWSWSGYTWEELLQDSEDKLEFLQLLDILVDGRFIEPLKDLTLQFRGSSNQRIIDVPKSLASGDVVIWDKLVR